MKYGLVALLLAGLLACPVIGAENPKVALDATDMPIEQAMAELAKQAGVQIICDTGLKATVGGSFQSIELEKLLDLVTQMNNLKWQKVYLPLQPDQKLTAEQIKARAEAIVALIGGPIIVTDPVSGKQKVFVEQDPKAQFVAPDTLGLKPVYVVSKPKVVAKETLAAAKQDAAARLQALEAERMKLMAQLTPEQRVTAMQQEMLAMMSLDPATRQQMMIDEHNARRNMDPQTRDAYRQMMRDTFRSMREQGLIPDDGDRRRGGPDRDGSDRRRGGEQQ